jgi:RNA polymerase sigma-70 factor (sigma-E family)
MGVGRLPAEFDAFVLGAAGQLSRLAYRLTSDAHDADGLVQETLLRVARHWRTAQDQPLGYARQTMVNLTKDEWRRRRRRPRIDPVPTLPDAPALEPGGGRPEDLLVALRALPARQRAVVVLRFWEDLSTLQTAELLGITEGTVKSTTSRALAALRAHLDTKGATHERP